MMLPFRLTAPVILAIASLIITLKSVAGSRSRRDDMANDDMMRLSKGMDEMDEMVRWYGRIAVE